MMNIWRTLLVVWRMKQMSANLTLILRPFDKQFAGQVVYFSS